MAKNERTFLNEISPYVTPGENNYVDEPKHILMTSIAVLTIKKFSVYVTFFYIFPYLNFYVCGPTQALFVVLKHWKK